MAKTTSTSNQGKSTQSRSSGSSNAGTYNTSSTKKQGLSSAQKSKFDSFKSEVASSLNVNLKEGYNGDISAKDAGKVGGEMVKRMIAYAENNMK